MKRFSPIAILLLACCGCDKTPDTLVKDGYDQKEMDAAIARAHREVDAFVTELSKPTGENHAVKAPIQDAGKTEHFWLIKVSYKDGEFTGTIDNDPGIVGNVKIGQTWTLKKEEISDWMFMRDGKMHGNYTMRPLLKTLPEEQAAKFRSMFATP
jgi:uncharacterized protein YegJ (DUF2314 family)